jgi:hypothetical protein
MTTKFRFKRDLSALFVRDSSFYMDAFRSHAASTNPENESSEPAGFHAAILPSVSAGLNDAGI